MTSSWGPVLALALLSPAGALRPSQASQAKAAAAVSASDTPMAISKLLINLEYVLPSGWVWDTIHKGHTNDGGVWHYASTEGYELAEMLEERHPAYESVWDVACNLGFFLQHLAEQHPERHFYGTDISEVMANATKQRCPSCATAVFDLNQMQYGKTPQHLPTPVDVIVVADVLNYISWGGWPPILNVVLPSLWTKGHRDVFWYTLTSLARQEVIFSAHERNSGVERFLLQMGAVNHGNFWTTPGRAGQKAPKEAHHWWGLLKNVDPPLLIVLSVATALVAFQLHRWSRSVALRKSPEV